MAKTLLSSFPSPVPPWSDSQGPVNVRGNDNLLVDAVNALAGVAIVPTGNGGALTWQTFDRRMTTSTAFAPTSGTLTLTGIWLTAGQVVTGITFVSGATAEAAGTHLWYALYKSDLTFMAQSADDVGAASFAANTALRKTLIVAQVCPATGLYYLGFTCTAGTVPTLLNVTAASANANGAIAGMTPITSATSSAGLVGVAPSPAGALTAIAQTLYAFID